MSNASDYMQQALAQLDDQMVGLQERLAADAAELQAALDQLASSSADTAALQAAADKVKQTADLVSGLAQPSAVADPEQPEVVAEPVPPAEETPQTPENPEAPAEPGASQDNGDFPQSDPADALPPGVTTETDADVQGDQSGDLSGGQQGEGQGGQSA